MFLTIEDYRDMITDSNLLDLIEQDADILDLANNQAIAEAENALIQRYDTEALFSQEGSQRNEYLLKLCKYLAIYELYKRCPTIEMPEYVKNDTLFARKELGRMSKGEIPLANAPRKVGSNEQSITVRRIISIPKSRGY